MTMNSKWDGRLGTALDNNHGRPLVEITKPSYEIAQDAYQVLMELVRLHPTEDYLAITFMYARRLIKGMWEERTGLLYDWATDTISPGPALSGWDITAVL